MACLFCVPAIWRSYAYEAVERGQGTKQLWGLPTDVTAQGAISRSGKEDRLPGLCGKSVKAACADECSTCSKFALKMQCFKKNSKKWQLPYFPYAAPCRQGFIDAFGYVAEPNASSLSGWPFILDGAFGTWRCYIARWMECKEGRSGESISQSADHARAARSASIGRAGYGRRLSDKAAKSCVV